MTATVIAAKLSISEPRSVIQTDIGKDQEERYREAPSLVPEEAPLFPEEAPEREHREVEREEPVKV